MDTLADAILAKLTDDAGFASRVPGGVWPRKLAPNLAKGETPTPLSTPDAFDAHGHLVGCACVVMDASEDADSLGPSDAYLSLPSVWLHAPATPAERSNLLEARHAAFTALHNQRLTVNGRGPVARVVGLLPLLPDPDLPFAYVTALRLEVAGVWGAI